MRSLILAAFIMLPLPAAAQKVSAPICEASANIVTQVVEARTSGKRQNRAEREAIAALPEQFSTALRPAVYIIVPDVYGWSRAQLQSYTRADWLDQCLSAG